MQNWMNLKNELDEIDWSLIFNTGNLFSNPSVNYSNFIKKISELKNKYLPTKKVRFKRYKHKNNSWITNGLLTSIRQKDILYKQFNAIPINHVNYEQMKSRYKSYEKQLKSLIQTVKKDYFNKQFLKFNSDINNTWLTIKSF